MRTTHLLLLASSVALVAVDCSSKQTGSTSDNSTGSGNGGATGTTATSTSGTGSTVATNSSSATSSGATSSSSGVPPTVPPIAASVGYNTQTFVTSTFTTANTDTQKTYQSGLQWYGFNFYGSVPTFANVTINPNGTITVGQGGNNYNGNLCTAAGIPASPHFVGTAFGGGAYIEATASFNAQGGSIASGWPAIWTAALEHQIGVNEQWPGQQAGYLHYTENDIMEYFQGAYSDPLDSYASTNIDWYGLNSGSKLFETKNFTVSQAAFANQNTYAMLWVPATSATQGYIEYFFNGMSQTKRTYTQLTNTVAPPPTAATPWAYGIIDKDHLDIVLGSNNSSRITVSNVQVWQASAAGNMHN